ncbi:MAG: cytochrome c biogenesis protein CcmE, partial [Hyphomicrobiaceae bacterium]|nr:cytochrome c biogenesis protein CcmE [Hyphomicrobiaceae bacterium]
MTRKQRRGALIGLAVAGLSVATILMMFALRQGVDYFYPPSRVIAGDVAKGVSFRLGGLVAKDSLKRGEGTHVSFAVTDTTATVPVIFEGILPD